MIAHWAPSRPWRPYVVAHRGARVFSIRDQMSLKASPNTSDTKLDKTVERDEERERPDDTRGQSSRRVRHATVTEK